MALKGILTALDEVPPELHEHYAEKDGKFYLQAEGLEVVAPLKSAHERQKADNVKLRAERDALLAKYEDLDPEAARKAMERLSLIDDSKLVDSGKLEELIASKTEKMRADYEKRVAKAAEDAKAIAAERDQFASKYTTTLMDNEITNAAAKLGVKPGAMGLIKAEARQKFKVFDGRVAQAGEDGEPVMGKDGLTPVSVEEWLGGMQADLPEVFTQDRGGGALNNGRSVGTVRTIRRSDPDYANKANRYFEDIADGKVEVVD